MATHLPSSSGILFINCSQQAASSNYPLKSGDRSTKLFLSLLEVRDTYNVPGTDHNGFGCEAACSEVENLIKADGFKGLRSISNDDCFMMPKESEVSSYINDKSIERRLRDPQPNTWDKLIKERDGKELVTKAEMFRYWGDELVQLTEEFEFPPSSEGVVAYGSTPDLNVGIGQGCRAPGSN
ncbi:MAG: hypothetical protein Q9202_004751 [Teloschistes flavicans]